MALTRSKGMDREPPAPSAQQERRRRSERRGRWAEWLAAGLLICKGYRILDRRVKTPFGEVDLIALRGRRIAFVEVKYRRDFGGNGRPVTHNQAERVAKAAEYWLWRQRDYRTFRIGLDCILISTTSLPAHIPDALQPST